jgi:hypothetical protein
MVLTGQDQFVGLGIVVLLAKSFSPATENIIIGYNLPLHQVGVIIYINSVYVIQSIGYLGSLPVNLKQTIITTYFNLKQ